MRMEYPGQRPPLRQAEFPYPRAVAGINKYVMAQLNTKRFIARFKEAGKNLLDSSFRVVESFGTISTRAKFGEQTQGWFILVKDEETGEVAPVWCAKNPSSIQSACSLWEIKELEQLTSWTSPNGTVVPAGHRSFKAYPVIEEAE